MKIARLTLDRIISQEVSRVLAEASRERPAPSPAVQRADVLDDPLAAGLGYDQAGNVDDSYEGYSKFQSAVNDFLDSAGYEPGVWYFWDNEDMLIILGNPEDAHDIAAQLHVAPEGIGGAPSISPSPVELEDGAWAVKLNAQMEQD